MRGALADLEAAKTDNLHAVARLERVGHRLDESGQALLCIFFADVCIFRDCRDKFILVNCLTPLFLIALPPWGG